MFNKVIIADEFKKREDALKKNLEAPDLILLGIARKRLNDFTKWRGLNSYNIEEFIQNKNTARADINRYYGLSEIQDV